MFANHRYANASTCFCGAEQSSWQSEIGANVATFPILGTEYGWFNHQGAPHPTWNNQLFAYLAQPAVPAGLNGAIAFVWHWVDDNSMTTPDVGAERVCGGLPRQLRRGAPIDPIAVAEST